MAGNDGIVTRAEVAELRELVLETRELADAALHALIGRDKRQDYLDAAADSRWVRRYMEEPIIATVVGLQASDALMWASCEKDERGPTKGYMTLKEVAAAGRSTIAAVKGVGPKTMAKLDKALVKYKLTWADVA